VFSNRVDGVIGVFENLYATLVGNSIIPDMLNDIIGAVKNFDLPGAFDGPLSDALGTVQDMAGEFLKSGKELASSVADGIKSKASAVGNAASDIASKARNKMPFSPAKEGPLSDLDKVGPAFVDVVAEGMESDADRVDEASRLVAENARPQTSRARSAGGAGTADVEAALASADRTDEVLRKLDQVVRALEALSTGEIREKDVLRALNIAEDRHSGRDPLP
jgi:methyl-accepting chemotaxis protein